MTISFADYTVVVAPLGLGALFILLAPVLVSIIAAMRIVQRAGYSGWWIVLALVPVVNMVALWCFAVAPWPALQAVPHRSEGC